MAASKKARVSATVPPPPAPTGAALARKLTQEAIAANAARRDRAAKGSRAFNAAELLAQAKAQGRTSVDLELELERHQAQEQQATPSAGVKGKNPPPPLIERVGSGRSGPFIPEPRPGESELAKVGTLSEGLDPDRFRRRT